LACATSKVVRRSWRESIACRKEIQAKRSVGGGVVEMKIDFGPGYRVYYIQRGALLTLLLCGGDKSVQTNDIKRAKALSAQWAETE
jgi:putative addiction module killer protein